MLKKITVFLALTLVLCLSFSVGAQTTAKYDTVSIYDLQYVSDPSVEEESSFLGDTVVVKAMLTCDVRGLWIGARWACFACDPDHAGEPWSGFFLIQNDTLGNAINTGFQYLQPGDVGYFTGRVETYTGLTQLALLTKEGELVPVDVISGGNPLPDPKVLTLDQLATKNAGEQWESMLVRVENATVTNDNYTSNQVVVNDGTGTGYIDDYFLYYSTSGLNNPYPVVTNTALNYNGFVRDLGTAFSVNPRNDSDFEILTSPPQVDVMGRTPGVPTSSDPVEVKAVIVDNGTIASANLVYSVDDGDFTPIAMTITNGDTFAASIPASPNNSHVRYFVQATDNDAEVGQSPGDTAVFVYQYVIRDGGLTIKDVQYDWGYDGTSPFRTDEVTLEGVVTVDTTNWVNNYYIQEKDSAWHAIWVYDPDHKPLKGDWIRITGTVQENYDVTRLEDITQYEVISQNNPFEPVSVTTGEISTNGDNGEAYESVLVKLSNLTVSDPFPDSPGNYGEFEVDDGSGGVRVDDAMTQFSGNLDSTFHLNDTIEELIGIHYYSYGDYKLLPRSNEDVVNHVVVGINDQNKNIAATYQLEQNYPNPFNPETTIRFNVPQRSEVSIAIFNVLGQKVRTLFSGIASPGVKELKWNGLDDHGVQMGSGIYFYHMQSKDFSMTRKMILMK